MENNQKPDYSPPGGAATGQPRLKKVKRPIKRLVPQAPSGNGGNGPTGSSGSLSGDNRETMTKNNPFIKNETGRGGAAAADAFNLDAFLDGEEKIPALNQLPGKYNSPQPQFIDDEYELENGPRTENDTDFPVSDLPPYLTKKVLVLIGMAILVFGMVISKLLFGTSEVVHNGLQGVVVNPEVPRGRARCGLAEKTQGCVLYIMNPQRQDLNARDFYDLAAQMTGRQRFVIETGNMRYANTKIRPGDIAQLNIPPL